jgi:hypothetical protein
VTGVADAARNAAAGCVHPDVALACASGAGLQYQLAQLYSGQPVESVIPTPVSKNVSDVDVAAYVARAVTVALAKKHKKPASKAKKSKPERQSTLGEILKSNPDHRYTLGVAYYADRADVGTARDGFRDYVGREVLEANAWNYLTKHRQIGVGHEGQAGKGDVVESYIYRGPDWKVGSDVVKAGDWLLGCVWDAATWPAVKSGQLTGYSFQGSARRRTASADDVAKLRRS